jgi:UDP-3-O-[3-hydroxymyristoyl] glucosamine N-acyltransferase
MENKLWLKAMAALKNLPKMQKTVRRLAKKPKRK